MDVKEGAGVDGQVPDAQPGHLLHHQVEHIVAVAQVVVEGYGHAVPQSGERHGLPAWSGTTFTFITRPPFQAPSSWADGNGLPGPVHNGRVDHFPAEGHWRRVPCSLASADGLHHLIGVVDLRLWWG